MKKKGQFFVWIEMGYNNCSYWRKISPQAMTAHKPIIFGIIEIILSYAFFTIKVSLIDENKLYTRIH
jgi:hypothetical protein